VRAPPIGDAVPTVELAAIVAGLLITVGGLVALAGIGLHVWVTGHESRPDVAPRRAGMWPGRPGRQARTADGGHTPPASGLAGGSALALTLILGLAALALAAAGLGTLVDNVTDGDGIAVLDHPVARFVTAHRAPALTPAMKVVSAAAGPAGMTVCALILGVLLSVVWRSWTPVAALAATAAGVIGLTIAFKEALARPRPPLAYAVAAADGYGFPSAHAAAAAAVCGATAWLCGARMRSWRARVAVWAVAAMLAALVGISRVYLGVHWATDVIGGWIFGILWLAVVVSGWAGIARRSHQPDAASARPVRRRNNAN
jgi:membrane-associated phospholipid phosphatase